MRPAKIVSIIIGALLILIALAMLAPGIVLLWLNGTTDTQGFFMTPHHTLQSDGYAVATGDIQLDWGNGRAWIPGGGKVRIEAASSAGGPVFVGIAPTNQVTAYLGNVEYDEVTNIGYFSSGGVEYRNHSGDSPSTPPGEQTFWVAQQQGDGARTVEWEIQSGNWTAVVMNADGSSPVSVDVRLGAHLGFLLGLGIGLTVGGVVLLAVGILLVVLGARHPHRPTYEQPPYQDPRYNQPPYNQPPSNQPPYGQPPYNQPPYNQPQQGAQYSQRPSDYAPYAPPPYASPAPGQQKPPEPVPPPTDQGGDTGSQTQ